MQRVTARPGKKQPFVCFLNFFPSSDSHRGKCLTPFLEGWEKLFRSTLKALGIIFWVRIVTAIRGGGTRNAQKNSGSSYLVHEGHSLKIIQLFMRLYTLLPAALVNQPWGIFKNRKNRKPSWWIFELNFSSRKKKRDVFKNATKLKHNIQIISLFLHCFVWKKTEANIFYETKITNK